MEAGRGRSSYIDSITYVQCGSYSIILLGFLAGTRHMDTECVPDKGLMLALLHVDLQNEFRRTILTSIHLIRFPFRPHVS